MKRLMTFFVALTSGAVAMAAVQKVEKANDGTGNLSKLHREELVKKIGAIRELSERGDCPA